MLTKAHAGLNHVTGLARAAHNNQRLRIRSAIDASWLSVIRNVFEVPANFLVINKKRHPRKALVALIAAVGGITFWCFSVRPWTGAKLVHFLYKTNLCSVESLAPLLKCGLNSVYATTFSRVLAQNAFPPSSLIPSRLLLWKPYIFQPHDTTIYKLRNSVAKNHSHLSDHISPCKHNTINPGRLQGVHWPVRSSL